MKKLKKAFTLIELMVVIAIIAVLAGVSIVGYSSFVDREKERSAITEATQAREIITAEVIKAKDGIIAEGVIAKDGKISISINDPSGTVILSYENGELQVRTEIGIIRNESKKPDGFDAMLRKAFPSLAPLPGFFSIDGSIISYHSDYDNESENIIVDVITGDLLKQKDKDSDSGSSSGEESGSETPSSSDRVRAVFEQSFLPIAPGTPYTISYKTSGPEGTVSSLITSGESIEPVDGEIPTGAGTITINAISEGTSYIYLIATDGKNKAEAKLTVTVDKDAKIPVALPKQLNTITYDGKVHGDDVKWDIPPGAMIVKEKTETGSEPKRYSATFALIDIDKYCWALDGSDGEKQVEWVLSKKPLPTPFQVGKLTTTSGSADVDTGDGFIADIFDKLANKIINSLDKSSIINALAVDKYPTWDTGDWSKLEKDKEYTIENQKGRTVGEYTATFTLIGTAVDHYYWEENENSASIKAKWSINRTQVPIPTINAEKENGVYILGYKEGGVEPDLNLDDGLKSIIDVSGDTEGSEVGKVYEIKLDLKTVLDSYTDCFEWKDGTTTTKTLKWKIAKMYLDDPVSTNGYTFAYNGKSQGPNWKDSNNYEYKYYTYSKIDIAHAFPQTHTVEVVSITNDSKTDAGEYTATFHINDQNNYGWKNGGTGDKTVTWKITKAVASKKLSINNVQEGGSVDVEFDSNKELTITNSTGNNSQNITWTTESNHASYLSVSRNGNKLTLKNLNTDMKNDYSIKVTITDSGGSNYEPQTFTFYANVKKGKEESQLNIDGKAEATVRLKPGENTSLTVSGNVGNLSVNPSEPSGNSNKKKSVYGKLNGNTITVYVGQEVATGQYDVKVTDPGDSSIQSGEVTIHVFVYKDKSSFKLKDSVSDTQTVNYSSSSSQTVKFEYEGQKGTVTVTDNNRTGWSISNGNNTISITVPKRASGTKTFTLKDSGDSTTEAKEIKLTITINK